MAEKQNSKISKHEFSGDFVIGLDENTNMLFFYKQTKEKETATEDIREIKARIEVIQESSIEEIAVLKAELKTSNQRFKEVSELLQKEHEFHLPNSPTYDDIKEQEDDLRNQFDPIQQQLPPDVGGRNGID